jgi:hypothetical protein
MISRVQIPTEGPNGLAAVQGLHFVDSAHIYLYEKYQPKYIVTNWKGEKLEKVKFATPDSMPLFNHFGVSANRNIVLDDKIYFTVNELVNVKFDQEGFLDQYSSEYVYDIKADSLYVLTTASYPIEYGGKAWPNFFPYYKCEADKKIIFSWPASDSLLVYDTQLGTSTRKYAGSKFTKNLTSIINSDQNQMVIEDAEFKTYSYGNIIFDSYQKVYYRILNHPIKEGLTKSWDNFTYSIIILDENFRKVGETALDDRKMAPYVNFISKDGIYLSSHNFNNPELSEDEMNFTLYKLNPVEKD